MSTVLFDTSAAVSVGEVDIYIRETPVTIKAFGLSAGEVIRLKMTGDGGASWDDVNADGGPVDLTSTNDTVSIYSPMRISFEKSTTSNAVRVVLVNGSGN